MTPKSPDGRLRLVLLHGWGANERVWNPLLPALGERYAPSAPRLPPVADPLGALGSRLPERAVYVGWSLGGALALRLAARSPERVQAVVCVAANPCFVRRPGWAAGMPERDFAAFAALAARDRDAAMLRFQGLVVRGEPRPKARLRELRGLLAGAPVLSAQLDLLRSLDMRDAQGDIAAPCMHVLGARDALVPCALADALPRHHRVAVLDGAGHAPFLSRPDAWLALLDAFVADHLGPAPAPVDKSRVALGFARAARSYDSAAALQSAVGRSLLRWSRPSAGAAAKRAPTLDLGCGTGAWLPALAARRPDAAALGADIAWPMLERARRRSRALWLCGDAERLPIRSASLGLVWSNLALQWCADLPALMSEVWRVLAPGGRFAFSVLGPDSLWELRSAWRMLDRAEHVRRFFRRDEWRDAMSQAGFEDVEWRAERRLSRYAALGELVAELRALGASNRGRLAAGGLAGRRRWQALERAYRGLCAGALGASWQILYARMEKPSSRSPACSAS